MENTAQAAADTIKIQPFPSGKKIQDSGPSATYPGFSDLVLLTFRNDACNSADSW